MLSFRYLFLVQLFLYHSRFKIVIKLLKSMSNFFMPNHYTWVHFNDGINLKFEP